MRRIALWAALALVAWGLVELTAAAGLALLRSAGKPVEVERFVLRDNAREILGYLLERKPIYTQHDPELGWSILGGGERGPYHANGQGFRGDHDYAPAPPTGVLRVASFGDSFTHGTDVANADTWQAQMEAADPALEVLNFGVGAFGLDQSLLRWERDGRGFAPQVVLIGFLSENLNRNVSVFRPFYVPRTSAPLSKPRFVLAGDGLQLRPNPLPRVADYRPLLETGERFEQLVARLGEADYFYQTRYRPASLPLPSARLWRALHRHLLTPAPYRESPTGRRFNTASEAYRVTLALFDRFVASVRASGARPLILLFPHKDDIRQFREHGTRPYAPLLRDLLEKGYPVLDLLDEFNRADAWRGGRRMFVAGKSHYDRAGNGVVARALLRTLRSNNAQQPPAQR
ncbi:MAG: hypothetical protein LJE84_02080 [Gammaproteobacteria bacterium]|jgi:hypothetical protein|nr:hypothetical protein [Gammaproteobacteria bacterium]